MRDIKKEARVRLGKGLSGMADPSDFVDWSISCLEAEVDSKNIGIHASLGRPSSMFEVEPHLRGSFNDLDLQWPDFRTSILCYAADIAQEISNRTIDAFLNRKTQEWDTIRSMEAVARPSGRAPTLRMTLYLMVALLPLVSQCRVD